MRREPYSYMILRYRHDAVAGEQLNVGVVVHAPHSNFLAAEFRKAYGRISKVFPDLQGRILRNDLTGIERAFRRLSKRDKDNMFSSAESARSYAEQVIAKEDSSFIWSDIGSGVTSDPEKTLQDLFSRFVTQYDTADAARKSDADVWKPFRDRLAERKIERIFEPKRISSTQDEVEFDYAWKNGKWHCFQPVSFDLASADSIQEKAARWVGHMVGLQSSSDKFEPYFVVGKPTNDHLITAYNRAVAFIQTAPLTPTIILEQDLDKFADELEDKVNLHEQSASTA